MTYGADWLWKAKLKLENSQTLFLQYKFILLLTFWIFTAFVCSQRWLLTFFWTLSIIRSAGILKEYQMMDKVQISSNSSCNITQSKPLEPVAKMFSQEHVALDIKKLVIPHV
jgi:hypothetical protein